MPKTTKAVPFLSDADIATRAKGAANHPAIHANEESYGMGARWSRKLYELELQRLRQLVEEARVALEDLLPYALCASDVIWNTQNMSASPPLSSEFIQEQAAKGEELWRKYKDFKIPKPSRP